METTRVSLLMRVRDLRDQKSWDEFLEIYGPILLRYARRLRPTEADALDLVQDVLTIVVNHIPSFEYDPKKGRFRGWLRTITENRAKRVRAEDLRRPQAPGGTAHQIIVGQASDDADHVKQLMEEEWQKRCYEVALKRVRDETSKENWETFELCVLQGVPPGEVARRMGTTRNNVYQRVRRVRQRLQAVLEELDE